MHLLLADLKKLPWQTVDPPHLQPSWLQPCQTRQDCLHLATTWEAKNMWKVFPQKIWGLENCSYLTCVAGPYPLSLRAAILNIANENKISLKLQHCEIYQKLLLLHVESSRNLNMMAGFVVVSMCAAAREEFGTTHCKSKVIGPARQYTNFNSIASSTM